MCGILLLSCVYPKYIDLISKLESAISRRGPTLPLGSFLISKNSSLDPNKSVYSSCIVSSSVLHIQGDNPLAQPYLIYNEDVLGYFQLNIIFHYFLTFLYLLKNT